MLTVKQIKNYSTIYHHLNKNKIKLTTADKALLGKCCTKYCELKNIEIANIFMYYNKSQSKLKVNLYPKSAIDQILFEFGLKKRGKKH